MPAAFSKGFSGKTRTFCKRSTAAGGTVICKTLTTFSHLNVYFRVLWINNSCTYDGLTTTLFNLWQENPVYWHQAFCTSNSRFLATLSGVILCHPLTPLLADHVGDKLQSMMYSVNNNAYQVGHCVSVLNLALHVLYSGKTVCTGVNQCSNAHVTSCDGGADTLTSYFIELPIKGHV